MPSQEIRDAAMAAYDAALKDQAPPEEPTPEAKPETVATRQRDATGRWVTQETKPAQMHGDDPAPISEPDTKPDGKPPKEKAPEPKEDKPQTEEEKAELEAKAKEDKKQGKEPKKPFKDLTVEEQRARLDKGYSRLVNDQAKLEAEQRSIEAQRQAWEQEKQTLPAKVRQEQINKFRQDRTGYIIELAKEAGLDFRKLYEDEFTPRMLNGGRPSTEEEIRTLRQAQEDWEAKWQKQQSDQLRATQDAQMAQAKAVFTRMVTANEDTYPYVSGMLEPSEIADAAMQLVPALNKELGRVPTDVEIAGRLDETLKARYLKSEKLRKLNAPEALPPNGGSERGGADQTANPEGRKPRTVTNGIAAKASTSTRPMSRDEARAAALKLWPSS